MNDLRPSEWDAVLWQKQTRTTMEAVEPNTTMLILPIGAVEQHGPHLPLDTDSTTALAISALAALTADFPTFVLPPIWCGLSPHWLSFAGTITLGMETIRRFIADVCESVASHGFRRLVILNGHAGNAGLIEAVAVSESRARFRVAAISYWNLIPDQMRELAPEDGGDIGHAGAAETAIQLFLQQSLVAQSAIPQPGTTAPSARAPVGVYQVPNPARENQTGVYGNSSAATAERGEAIVHSAADRLVVYLREFQQA